MTDGTSLTEVSVRELHKRFLRNAIDAAEHDEQQLCTQARPIAAPVRHVVHTICEKRKEAVGLVQRHVLRALHTLNEASAKELDDIIGIGVDRVERILARAAQHNTEVESREDGTYAVSSEALTSWEHKGYESIVEHRRRFIINGLTGDLLPIAFWANHKACELLRGDGGDFALREGSRVREVEALPRNLQATGDSAIDALLDERDLAMRRVLGLPDAAVARSSSARVSVTGDSWVLAFLLVLADGTVRCYSAGGPSERLRLRGAAERDYVECLFPGFLGEVASDVLADDDRVRLAPTSEPGVMSVTVVEPAVTLSHSAYTDDVETASGDGATKLTMPIQNGLIWLPGWRGRWAYLRLLPGDRATAERVCVLRGVRRLRNYLASVDGSRLEEVDIEAWWKSCQEEYFASVPDSVRAASIDLGLLRDQIMGNGADGAPAVSDTAFLERFDRCFSRPRGKEGRSLVEVERASISRLVVNGMAETGITSTLLSMLESATNDLYLISPMCEDGRVVSRLKQIGKRDVRVYLLSEIRERAKGHNPQFRVRKWQELDRQRGKGLSHVHSLRSLVKSGVLCRGTKGYPHAKLALVDTKAVLISSANLSPNSLGGGGGYSYEAGLYVEDPQTVDSCRTLFNALWAGSPIRQHMVSGDVSITEETSNAVDPGLLCQEIAGGLLLCANFPPKHAFLTETIIRCLRDAREDVTLVALSVYNTCEIPELHKAIKDALSKGVCVRCIVREDHGFGDQWPDKSTQELLDDGMNIEMRVGLHAKGVLVDNTRCGMFSANLNPFSLDPSLPTAHLEIGLFGPAGHRVIEPYAEFLRSL